MYDRSLVEPTYLRLAVVVCSVGRAACLALSAPFLAMQSRRPDRLVYVVASEADLPPGLEEAFPDGPPVEVLMAPTGLARQRNCALDALTGACDIVLFLDDDYLPAPGALAGLVRAFDDWPQVNGMTGRLIADGFNLPDLGHAEAALLIAHDVAGRNANATPTVLKEGLEGLYGCNMAFRMAALGGARFDERLPLYAWLEDTDFAARIPGGRIKTDAFAGVHLGLKSGRETKGVRLGYSQIANPLYLWRKGTIRWRFALKLALRCMVANHLRSLTPEAWVNRVARARGNRMALADILRGCCDPARILELDD